MSKGQVSIWVSYVKRDSQEFIEEIREELNTVDPQIRLKTFVVVLEDGQEEYLLRNGQRINTLTDAIVRSPGLVYFFSEHFSQSKYSCHELGWRLRNKSKNTFFLHVNQKHSEKPDYYSNLAKSVIDFADDEIYQPSFVENYEPMPAVDEIHNRLRDRTENTIIDAAKDARKVAKAISAYADASVRNQLKFDLSKNFISWLQVGGGARLRNYLDTELAKDGLHLNDFSTSLFDTCSIEHVHRFESLLVGYHASLGTPRLVDKDDISVAAGFLSLTLFERSYIESIRSFEENNVLLEFDIPSISSDSGSAAAAIAVGIAKNNIPKLKLQSSASLELSGLTVEDAITVTELKPDREPVDDYEKSVRDKFVSQLWRVVLGTAAPAEFSSQHWQQLVGVIKRHQKLNRHLNIHFTVNTDEYGAIDDWCNLVQIAVEELNQRMRAGSENIGTKGSDIPTIIIRTGNPHSELPWSTDHTQRIEHLKAILELCR